MEKSSKSAKPNTRSSERTANVATPLSTRAWDSEGERWMQPSLTNPERWVPERVSIWDRESPAKAYTPGEAYVINMEASTPPTST